MKGLRILALDVSNAGVADAVATWQTSLFPSDAPVDIPSSLWWWARVKPATGLSFCVGLAGLQVGHQGDAVTGYLSLAGVVPGWRGLGIHKDLIRKRITKARELGLLRLVTDTYNNPASANNLIDLGFRTFMPDAPWKADGAVYWFKDLA